MFDRHLLKLPGIKAMLCACVAFSLTNVAIILFQVCSLAYAIVDVWNGAFDSEVVWAVLIFAICYCLRTVISHMQASFLEKRSHRIACELRRNMVDVLYEDGISMVSSYGSAAIARELIDGFREVEDYLSIIVPKTIAMLIVPIALMVCVFFQDIISGFIVLICYPLIIVFMRLIGYSASDESAKRHDGFLRMSGHFIDALRGMSTLKAFGVSKQYSKSVFKVSEKYRRSVMKTLRIATLSSAVLDLFATGGLAAVAIMLGFRLVEGSVAFLPALIVLMLVPEFFAPIRTYASDYHASLNGKQALSKILEMSSITKRMIDFESIVVAGVDDALSDIREGEHIALVGASGAGKTTLLNVLAGTVDVKDMEFASFDKTRIAYIPQNPYIFSGTIRENISLYKPDVDDATLMAVIKSVGLEDLVSSADRGLDEVVGAGGRAVSGGEAHRIAIARALIDPSRDIWLLDEPGSSLDVELEKQLHSELLRHMQGRTAVIATHNMSWKVDVDRVIEVGARS